MYVLYVDGTVEDLSLARLYVSQAAKILEAARNRNGVAAELSGLMVEARNIAAELDKLVERDKNERRVQASFQHKPPPVIGRGPSAELARAQRATPEGIARAKMRAAGPDRFGDVAGEEKGGAL